MQRVKVAPESNLLVRSKYRENEKAFGHFAYACRNRNSKYLTLFSIGTKMEQMSIRLTGCGNEKVSFQANIV